MSDEGGLSRNAMWPPSSMDDGNFPLAKKLAMDNPDLAAELAILQTEMPQPSRLADHFSRAELGSADNHWFARTLFCGAGRILRGPGIISMARLMVYIHD
jgi:hypothetical protein